jgi:hypothetical protein
MRAEAVSVRIKNKDVRDDPERLQRLFDSAAADNQRAVEDRDSTILDLQTQLENRHRELNILEQSVTNTHVERTRLQLNFNEMSMTLVTVRQELEESRQAATAARVAEEAGRLQLARMMDEQLVQNQTIESLRRQLETSNTATRDAQALLRMNQEQQPQNGRMPPPTALPAVPTTLPATPTVVTVDVVLTVIITVIVTLCVVASLFKSQCDCTCTLTI